MNTTQMTERDIAWQNYLTLQERLRGIRLREAARAAALTECIANERAEIDRDERRALAARLGAQ